MSQSTTSNSADESPSSTDLCGRTIGEYHILRRIGRGGMAEVYLADQESLKRQVAIKVLRPEYTQDAQYLKRFRHEAKAAGSLNHANIVGVYQIGEADGIQFIAQEYVPGRNLKEFLKKKGPLDVSIALHIMRQVAQALEAAASAGVVHRDIKPENILLTRKGDIKVADFGLAQLTLQGEKVELTQVGVTMGTPLYMSPEQVAGGSLDCRSDLYSFGVMCFQMLGGKPPFTGETALAIAIQHINAMPPQLESLRADLPQPLVRLIHRLLSKKREDRHPDPTNLLVEIKQIAKQVSTGKPPAADQYEFDTRRLEVQPARLSAAADKGYGRQMALFVVAAIFALVAGAGIGWAARVPDPFTSPVPEAKQIPQLTSAAAQFYYAMNSSHNEDAFLAVIRYFPEAQLEVRRAKEKLGVIYLRKGDYAAASKQYDEFVATGQHDPNLLALGLAGQAIVASLQGDATLSATKMAEFDRKGLRLGVEMDELLRQARERNYKRPN
jgi:eukaryotic-like serine/threonine-protein kinase